MIRFYTIKEVADMLHKTTRTIRRYVDGGQLRAIRPTPESRMLFREKDIYEFLKIEDEERSVNTK